MITMASTPTVECIDEHSLKGRLSELQAYSAAACSQLNGVPADDALQGHPSLDLRWLEVLQQGLGHRPYCLAAEQNGEIRGLLPLVFVRSKLFGRFLVGLSFISSGGIRSADQTITDSLIDRAVDLADQLDVQYLELRHEQPIDHPALTHTQSNKVHCRLQLPDAPEGVLAGLKSKVRSQVRRGIEKDFTVDWGGAELLKDFYQVFSRNMRDLGTPVFGRKLFQSILERFGHSAELAVVRNEQQPIAAALLLHGPEVTEVPCASALQAFKKSNVNMFMYHRLLERSVERGSQVFDFGRSTVDSGPHRFKMQWGATASPAYWQYYVRKGELGGLRKENGRFQKAIETWQRLPVWLTNWLGPPIARRIP